MSNANAVVNESSAKAVADEFTIDIQRWAVNLFIVFHLSALCCCLLPVSPLQVSCISLFRLYLNITGTTQSWHMFSPNPVQLNTYLGATVHYKDGATRQYTFPRISKLGIAGKYREERWRKFIENTEANDQEAYWPYLARYAAIRNNTAPRSNPVVSIDLFRYQQSIPEPGNPAPRYLTMKMGSYHTIAMPSPGPLIANN